MPDAHPAAASAGLQLLAERPGLTASPAAIGGHSACAGGRLCKPPVRTYLPDFRTSDEMASERVTLRECLNHSAGWMGDYSLDLGRGEDALARYVAGMANLEG